MLEFYITIVLGKQERRGFLTSFALSYRKGFSFSILTLELHLKGCQQSVTVLA